MARSGREVSQPEVEEEKPLDPAAERLRRKMVRLLAVSIGTLFIGVMAVLGAVVYKLSGRSAAPAALEAQAPGVAVEGRIDLPEGAMIVSADLDGERVMLHVRLPDGRQRLLVHSLAGGGIIADLAID